MSCQHQTALPVRLLASTRILILLSSFFFNFSPANAQVNISVNRGVTNVLSVAYGNGVYIGISQDGSAFSSTDGMHFTAVTRPDSPYDQSAVGSLAFGNGLFVAFSGTSGDNIPRFRTSTDGIHWTHRLLPPLTDDPFYSDYDYNYATGLIYAGGQWITTGTLNYSYDDDYRYGYVFSSPDGINWDQVAVGDSLFWDFGPALYADGKFVLGGDDLNHNRKSYILYSGTGASGTWTRALIDTGESLPSSNGLVSLNNVLYAFTINGLLTSADLTTWAPLADPRFGPGSDIGGGLYAQGTYYLDGTPLASPKAYKFTSPDGITWTQQPDTALISFPTEYTNGIYYSSAGDNSIGCLAYSTDANNWTLVDASYNAVATNGSLFVTVGKIYNSLDAIFTSPDWSTGWTSRIQSQLSGLNGLTYGNGQWVAVGNQDTIAKTGNYATSPDGLTWTRGYTNIANDMRAVAYGNGKYVAVGSNGQISYSTTGRNWNQVEVNSNNNYYAVAYLNNYFVVAGGGTSKVRYSPDGITWTDVSPIINGQFQGITYGNGIYVLVGWATPVDTTRFFSMTTADITNPGGWSAPSYSIPLSDPTSHIRTGGIAYGNGQFIALGNSIRPYTGYILNSTDGLNWAATSTGIFGNFALLTGIAYSGLNDFKVVAADGSRIDVTAGGIPLPLTLLSFTGHTSGDQNLLTWQTSDETNTRNFEIGWSADGIVFSPIGTIAAAGMTTGTANYHYTHIPAPVGNDFYRLKMIDLDGHFTFSPVVELTVTGKGPMLAIWPNPIRDESLNISIPSGMTLPLTYVLYDAGGRTMVKGLLTQYSQTVDISRLGKGNYTLQFGDGTIKKLIKL